MSRFKDHFSATSTDYARYRPDYPPGLFEALFERAPSSDLAWDVATGSGQAALGLAAHFDRVIATDASKAQLDLAESHPRVEYRVEPAERSTLNPGSVALVTVAQALHWFDFDAFYAEVRRVCRPGAVIAAWSYGLHRVQVPGDPDEATRILARFYLETVGPYWPPERRFVEGGYESIPFPFLRLDFPMFVMEAWWNLEQLLGYLRTWSAVKRYRDAHKTDPVEQIAPAFEELWGPRQEPRRVEWPLRILVGRVE